MEKQGTQEKRILEYMKQGHSITPLDALHQFGCLRLGARIYDLRTQGHVINTKHVTCNGKTYASYSLVECSKVKE